MGNGPCAHLLYDLTKLLPDGFLVLVSIREEDKLLLVHWLLVSDWYECVVALSFSQTSCFRKVGAKLHSRTSQTNRWHRFPAEASLLFKLRI